MRSGQDRSTKGHAATADEPPTSGPLGALRGRLAALAGLVVLTAVVIAAVGFIRGGAGDGTVALADTLGGEVPTVGAQAPDFKAFDIEGQPVTLADFEGRPLWLVFQATWCSICRSELPDIEAAAGRIDVVAIHMREDRELVTDYAERLGMTIRSVPDPIGEISLGYLVNSVPTHFFIAADGTIAAIHKGAISPTQIDEKLAALGK